MRTISFRVMASAMAGAFLIAFLAVTSAAQTASATQGALNGTVTDPSGATVSGANVTVKNLATGAERTATTNDQGVFNVSQLDPGKYSVIVEAATFKKAIATGIQIDVAQQSSINIALEVGSVSEVVTVTASQEVINMNSPVLSNTVDPRQIRDLPLPDRNPLNLAGFQPGVAPTGNNLRGSSISGLRQTATNVKQDGINAMDNFVKTSSLFALTAPSLNATDEFTISTGTSSSDTGFGVVQVNLRTTGGTNAFHGSVFHLLRNDVLEANDFFNNLNGIGRPRERQNFFGFNAGGPVIAPRFGEGGKSWWNGKNRAFWFFAYEGFREPFQATVNRTVLTPEARTGLFTYDGTDNVRRSVNLLPLGNFHTLNPVTQAQINAMPAPNNTLRGDGLNTKGYSFNVSGADPNDKVVIRYDHQLVEKSAVGSHKLEFVMSRTVTSLFPDVNTNGIDAPFPDGISSGQGSTRWLMTAADHSTFGNNVSNEFRWGRQWSPVNFVRGAPVPVPFFVNFATALGGNAFTRGTGIDNAFQFQGRTTTVSSFQDNLSWIKGSHNLRFGADFEDIKATSINNAGLTETITLGTGNSANPTGLSAGLFTASNTTIFNRANALYADLMGVLQSASLTFNVTSPTSGFVPGATRLRLFRERDLAIYGEDQWKMRRNLTFNYGVRWEFQGVPTISNGLAIQVTNIKDIFGISGYGVANLFKPTAAPGAAPAQATLDFVSGKTGKGLYNNNWKNFAPFVGFAYSPDFKSGFMHTIFGEQGTSSIRGGYSWSYLHDGFTVISNVLGTGTTNPGLIQTAANNTPTGVLTSGGLPLTTPVFAMPTTDRANMLVNTNNGLFAFDPNLKIPYVQQWSIGFEREVGKNMAFEVRYVGNHMVRGWRANNFNEVNIFENGFLTEFLNAQTNLALFRAAFPKCGQAGQPACNFGNSALAGQVALPNMAKFFTAPSVSAANGFASTTFIDNLDNNNVGTMASTLAFSNTYRTNREAASLGIPANFFVANPNANFIQILGNNSMSNYHSLQVEFRRRFSGGLQFQADYTWSKALGDARDAFGNNQNDLTSFRTLRNTHLDYSRSNQDQTQRFIANSVYELPFGSGKHFLNSHGVTNQIVGGWSLGGIVTWQSGQPWYVVSNRTTFNSFNAANNPVQLTGITFEQFKSNIGLFRTGAGVFFVNPAILDIKTDANGKFVSSQLKAGLMSAPAPGTFGNFPINSLSSPNYFNLDLSIVKRWKIGERLGLEFKSSLNNALNHANFSFGNQTFDSTSFGQITTTRGSARIVNFQVTGRW